MDTRPKANDRSMVKRALEQEWRNSDCSNDVPRMIRKIKPKLKEEGIEIAQIDMVKYVELFINDMPSIIELMSNCNNIPINPFLDKICPDGCSAIPSSRAR